MRNISIHGPETLNDPSLYESWHARKPRSGWGIIIVALPSAVVNAVCPPMDPFGLCG